MGNMNDAVHYLVKRRIIGAHNVTNVDRDVQRRQYLVHTNDGDIYTVSDADIQNDKYSTRAQPPHLPPPEEAYSLSAIRDAARAAVDQDLQNGRDLEEVVRAFDKIPFTKQLLDRMLAGEGV